MRNSRERAPAEKIAPPDTAELPWKQHAWNHRKADVLRNAAPPAPREPLAALPRNAQAGCGAAEQAREPAPAPAAAQGSEAAAAEEALLLLAAPLGPAASPAASASASAGGDDASAKTFAPVSANTAPPELTASLPANEVSIRATTELTPAFTAPPVR